jgi:hypothetical protein
MSCRGQPAKVAGRADGGGGPVTLGLSLVSGIVTVGDFVVADISLVNVSPTPVWLNGRLALNREDDPPQMREVWILVVGPDGHDVPFECMKRLRQTNSDDYRVLKPHESISTEEVLTGCYRFERPGRYSLAAFYQDENPDRPSGPAAVPFISQLLQSAPITLEVRGLKRAP